MQSEEKVAEMQKRYTNFENGFFDLINEYKKRSMTIQNKAWLIYLGQFYVNKFYSYEQVYP